MRKAQLVSMDFVIAFVVFVFALSFFFFIIGNSSSYENVSLNTSAELVFSRMDQMYDGRYDYLDGSIIDKTKLDDYITENSADKKYDFAFRDFESPANFRKIDYCVFIENKTDAGIEIIRNFAASKLSNYSVSFGADDCGQVYNRHYFEIPKCKYGEEALSLSKPVLYMHDIMSLRVLMCGQKR